MSSAPIVPNIYRTEIDSVGLAAAEHANFSARCILYASTSNPVANRRQLLRLLYILIGCGLLLLGFIVCSIMNDWNRPRSKQLVEGEPTVGPKKSIAALLDKGRVSDTARRDNLHRLTMARLSSMIDERPSAVHSFFSSPK